MTGLRRRTARLRSAGGQEEARQGFGATGVGWAGALVLALAALAGPVPAVGQAETSLAAFENREGHREAAIARRAELMRQMEGGLAIVTSADRSQPNLYEFFVPDTENHDFVFLTGIYESQPPGSVLVLNPSGETWEFNEPDESNLVKGDAVQFCHVVTQGRNIQDVNLEVRGEPAQKWMAIAQCFAGPPEDPPALGSRTTNF